MTITNQYLLQKYDLDEHRRRKVQKDVTPILAHALNQLLDLNDRLNNDPRTERRLSRGEVQVNPSDLKQLLNELLDKVPEGKLIVRHQYWEGDSVDDDDNNIYDIVWDNSVTILETDEQVLARLRKKEEDLQLEATRRFGKYPRDVAMGLVLITEEDRRSFLRYEGLKSKNSISDIQLTRLNVIRAKMGLPQHGNSAQRRR